MISANDLRNKKFSPEQNGYNIDEVSAALNEAADTIEGYINENEELYRKMEVLANKIEEYREEEDTIKAALITAQKTAGDIESSSKEKAERLISESEEAAAKTISEANEKADEIISEAREFSSNLIKEKNEEAQAVITDAQQKANEAINSSKIVAQDILDQAKEISEDLISKSKLQAQAYRILAKNAKTDAKEFITKLVELYGEQLNALNSANLETADDSDDEQELEQLGKEVEALVAEMEEVQNSIPEEVVVDVKEEESAPAEQTEPQEEETVVQEEAVAEENVAEEEATDEETPEAEAVSEETEEPQEEEQEEPQDPMKAVEAFSEDKITPISVSSGIPEIEEEADMEGEEDKSLFDDENAKRPFENYFNVNNNDAHYDRSQTISLVPPEDEEENEPKFKGFFKKKK